MAVLDTYSIISWQPPRRRPCGVRYAAVLAVWALLLLINPPLALEIFRNRRPDSPIPRLRR